MNLLIILKNCKLFTIRKFYKNSFSEKKSFRWAGRSLHYFKPQRRCNEICWKIHTYRWRVQNEKLEKVGKLLRYALKALILFSFHSSREPRTAHILYRERRIMLTTTNPICLCISALCASLYNPLRSHQYGGISMCGIITRDPYAHLPPKWTVATASSPCSPGFSRLFAGSLTPGPALMPGLEILSRRDHSWKWIRRWITSVVRLSSRR